MSATEYTLEYSDGFGNLETFTLRETPNSLTTYDILRDGTVTNTLPYPKGESLISIADYYLKLGFNLTTQSNSGYRVADIFEEPTYKPKCRCEWSVVYQKGCQCGGT